MAPREKTSAYIGKPVKKAKVPVKVKPKPTKSLARELGTAANNQFKVGAKASVRDLDTGKVSKEKDFVAEHYKMYKGASVTPKKYKGYTAQEKADYAKRRKMYARQTGV